MALVVTHDFSDLAGAPDVIRSSGERELLIDWSQQTYIRSMDLVRARCVIELAETLGFCTEIREPSNTHAASYFRTMGGLVREPNLNPSDSYIPLIRIQSDRSEHIYEHCRRVFNAVKADTSHINRLCDALTELTDNIYYHAGEQPNSGWGYLHAQAYPKYRHIKFAMNDIGVGFYGSFERAGQLNGRSEEEIVRASFDDLVSSTGDPVRGLGLPAVREFIKQYQGVLSLWTGSIYVTLNSARLSVMPLTTGRAMAGTLLELKVNL